METRKVSKRQKHVQRAEKQHKAPIGSSEQRENSAPYGGLQLAASTIMPTSSTPHKTPTYIKESTLKKKKTKQD